MDNAEKIQTCKFRKSLDCTAGYRTRADCYICAALKAELQKIELLKRQESETRQKLREAQRVIEKLQTRLDELENLIQSA